MTLREYLNVVFATGSVFKVMSTLEEVYYQAQPDMTIDDVSRCYTQAAQELLDLPGLNGLPDYEIRLKQVIEPDEKYVDVGLHDTVNNVPYSISFVDWSDIVDLPVIAETNMSMIDIVAHTLWELTFHGWTRKEVLEARDGLQTIIDEETKNKAKTVTWDEFKKELEDYS